MAYCTKCGREVDTEKCAGQEYCKVCGHVIIKGIEIEHIH